MTPEQGDGFMRNHDPSFEPEPKHFEGVRELSGYVIAACIVTGLLIYALVIVVQHVL